MNLTKYTAALLISSCLLTGCSNFSKTVKNDDGKYVIASLEKKDKVKNILADDIYKNIIDTSSGQNATYNAVLQKLIDQKFPIDDAMETEADTIIDQIEEYYKNYFGEDQYEEELQNALISNGYSDLDQYRESMVKQIQYANFLLDYVDTNYDDVFDDYYKQCVPRYVSVIKISVTDMTNVSDDENAKLNEVKELLNNTDKSFGSIAQDYSDDSSANKKGEIGLVDLKDTAGLGDSYNEDVLNQAQSLNEGQVSDAISGTDGYYFVKVTSTDYDKIKKDLSDTDIDSPLIAYDDYLQYVAFQSYKITYKDDSVKKIIEKVIDDALAERKESRGETE